MSAQHAEAIALLFSGGLDSSVLLGNLLRKGRTVQPIYIRSGLYWEAEELSAARAVVAALGRLGLSRLVVLNLPTEDLYENHWSTTGQNVPDASTADEAVYLPGRNPLLLLKARLWCQLHGIHKLAIGCLANNPFEDAKEEFFAQFGAILDRATQSHVELLRPLADLTKQELVSSAADLPLEKTFSCIRPQNGLHCGQCNKCAERRAAFRFFDSGDPTQYATIEAATVSK